MVPRAFPERSALEPHVMNNFPKTTPSEHLSRALGLDPDAAPDGHEPEERPTVSPPFDPASFARTREASEETALDDEASESERPTVAPPFDVEAFAKESFQASSAADSPAPAKVQVPPILDLRQRLTAGDHVGALAVAESILVSDPGSIEARSAADDCRKRLVERQAAALGPLDRVPEVVVGHDQLRALHIDHRAGFLLSLVDGVSSFELILDICGMARPDAMRILSELVQEKIVWVQR